MNPTFPVHASTALALLFGLAAPASAQRSANPHDDGGIPPFQGVAHAAGPLTSYTDRNAWLAAHGTTTTLVDFGGFADSTLLTGTGVLAAQGICDVSGDSAFESPPGPTTQYIYSSANLNFPMFIAGTLPSEPFYVANRRDFPGPASTGNIVVELCAPATAIGAYVADQSPLGDQCIEIFDQNGFSLGVACTPGQFLPNSFHGIVSSVPFHSASFFSSSSSDSLGWDDLEFNGAGLGTPYCQANPNSTGAPASMSASGDASIGANDLSLRAGPVPNQPFVFFHGPAQVRVPFGNGFLCVGGGLVRILPPTLAAGNLAERHITDLAAAGFVVGTRHIQCWYRDPAGGGAFFNTSDGWTITFTP